jgi:hypothetical protein
MNHFKSIHDHELLDFGRKRQTKGEPFHLQTRFGESIVNGKYSQKLRTGQVPFAYFTPSIRDQILTVQRLPQAVLKITSFAKTKTGALRHLNYIARQGELTPEMPDGQKLHSDFDRRSLIDEWEALFFDESYNKQGKLISRNTLNLTLSSPTGSNRDAVLEAARDFLQKEFGEKHAYVFVRHNDTKNPHVHVMIAMRSFEGRKLDPRKHYLQKIRKEWAQALREKGIMVEASRRFERGLSGKSKNSKLVQARSKRHLIPDCDKHLAELIKQLQSGQLKPDQMIQAKVKGRKEVIRSRYETTAQFLESELKKIDDPNKIESYQKAIKSLREFSKGIFPRKREAENELSSSF